MVKRLRAWHFIVLLLNCLPPAAALIDPPAAQEAFIMTKKFMGLLAGMAVIGGAATLFAQEGAKPAKAAEGTLMVDGKNYPLTHALAYETTITDEELIAVVLSGQPISS